MATKQNSTCEIIVKVQTGTTTAGKASYTSRKFGSINPTLSNDDILEIGQKLAGLQKYTLGMVKRQEAAEIIAG